MLKNSAYYIIIVVFIISVGLFALSVNYKTSYTTLLIEKRDAKREFVITLSNELRRKAGVVISKNNFDPILPNTILRVMLRTPENYIASYKYSGNLVINAAQSGNVIDLRDIIRYAPVQKVQNSWNIALQ